MAKPSRDAAVEELVTANHILAQHRVVDGFGHVSIRDTASPNRFLISRSMAPALVTARDVMSLDLDGNPDAGDERHPYLERFIHGEIYRARPDVRAIVHSHTPSVIPFGVVPSARLRPVFHMGATLGPDVPTFEIRDAGGPATDMLVRDAHLGEALARTLATASVVLMRGHGMTVIGNTLREAVYRAVYADVNARLQADAMRLGPPEYLNDEEIAAAARSNDGQIDRTWALWEGEVGKAMQ